LHLAALAKTPSGKYLAEFSKIILIKINPEHQFFRSNDHDDHRRDRLVDDVMAAMDCAAHAFASRRANSDDKLSLAVATDEKSKKWAFSAIDLHQ